MGDVDRQAGNGGGVGAAADTVTADAAATAPPDVVGAADVVGGSDITSPRESSSRRGSAASTATTSAAADQKSFVEMDPEVYGEQHFRRRSSLMAPLAGGSNAGLGSTSGDGGATLGAGGGGGGGGADGLAGSEGDAGVTAAAAVAADGKEGGYQEVVAWVKEHLVLPEFVPEQHWREEHNEVSPK